MGKIFVVIQKCFLFYFCVYVETERQIAISLRMRGTEGEREIGRREKVREREGRREGEKWR